MGHIRDIREVQGLVRGRLSEAEARITQLPVVVVGQAREIEMLGGVATRQSELLGIHRDLILMLERENQRKFNWLEKMLDLRGWSFGNPILIDLDLEEREADVITLVERE